jgi:quercetin dioxygenase-like cupin family protein
MTLREQHLLNAPLLTFDIQTVLSELKNEEAWKKGPRNARTLSMGRGLRPELVAVHQGESLPSHSAPCPITFQVVEGKVIFKTPEKSVTLQKGQLLVLQADIPHTIEALEESAFLLTLAIGK